MIDVPAITMAIRSAGMPTGVTSIAGDAPVTACSDGIIWSVPSRIPSPRLCNSEAAPKPSCATRI